MNVIDAMRLVDEGKAVRRRAWATALTTHGPDFYGSRLAIKRGPWTAPFDRVVVHQRVRRSSTEHATSDDVVRRESDGVWTDGRFDIDDLLADDWEEVPC